MQYSGRPDGPLECLALSAGDTNVVLQCTPGYDGGASAIYVVYALPTTSDAVIVCPTNTAKGQLLKLNFFCLILFVG